MASAASLLEQLKAGKQLARENSLHGDYLWMDGEKVTYAKYLGEGDWSYESFTLEDIANWTDDGDWEVQGEHQEHENMVNKYAHLFKKKE